MGTSVFSTRVRRTGQARFRRPDRVQTRATHTACPQTKMLPYQGT